MVSLTLAPGGRRGRNAFKKVDFVLFDFDLLTTLLFYYYIMCISSALKRIMQYDF